MAISATFLYMFLILDGNSIGIVTKRICQN